MVVSYHVTVVSWTGEPFPPQPATTVLMRCATFFIFIKANAFTTIKLSDTVVVFCCIPSPLCTSYYIVIVFFFERMCVSHAGG